MVMDSLGSKASRSTFEAGKRQGLLEGEQRARSLVLNFLYEKYLDPAIERGSVEGEAILTITREVSELLKNAPHG
jgi:hypothetical protein